MTPKNRPWFKFWPENVPQYIAYPQIPLFQFLTDTANQYPNHTAFRYQGLGISYRELNAITNKLALALRTMGVKKRDRVLIFLPNSLQFIIGYYGIIKTGAVVVPTNPLYKGPELWQRISDSKVKMIITNKALYPLVKETVSTTKVITLLVPDDEEAIDTTRRLAKQEGLLVGTSSGANICAALQLDSGQTQVVTVLPDRAERYFSTALI